jgi:hypothetical protein
LLLECVDGTLDCSNTISNLAVSFPILNTMNSQTWKALMRNRAAVKSRVTQIKKYFDNLQENVDVLNANVRLHLLEKAWEK